jgi:transcriptional regulator with XRE-family HTH domain
VITREQIRMARAALDWTAQELADKAGVAVNTIRRIEGGSETMVGTLTKIQSVLEAAGIVFIAENGGGLGVRFARRAREA